MVGGGGEDNPLLNGGVLLSISLTPAPLVAAQMSVTVSQYLWMETTANTPGKSLAWLLVVTRMIHFLVGLCCGGLDGGDDVIVPQDGGHGEIPGQVPGVVDVGGEDDPHFLVVISSLLSLPPQLLLRRP